MLSSVTIVQGGFSENFVPSHTTGLKKEEISSSSAHQADETKTNSKLSQDKQNALQKLKASDQDVRAHEQAHLSAAGGIASSGANFTFAIGPDGKRYAIAGEVQIDASAIPGDPKATIQKAEQIRKAALAPANPSAQDQSVAANATAMANQARIELLKQNQQLDETNPDNRNRLGSILDISA